MIHTLLLLDLLGSLCPDSSTTGMGQVGCALTEGGPIVPIGTGAAALLLLAWAVRRIRDRGTEAKGAPPLVFPVRGAPRPHRPASRGTPARGAELPREELGNPGESARRSPAPRSPHTPASPGMNGPDSPTRPQEGSAPAAPTTPSEGDRPRAPRRGGAELLDGMEGGDPDRRPGLSSAGAPVERPVSVSRRNRVERPDSGGPPDERSGFARRADSRDHADPLVPLDGTLQLLPGRLEVTAGDGAGREVRFVRIPGEEPAVTFGRKEGDPYRHVRLSSPTVSRLHARLLFREGRWALRNESSTNPTLLNGRPLEPLQAPLLEDGDRIEMGEVTLVFHQPEVSDRLPLRSSWYTDRGRRPVNQDIVAVRTLTDRRELAVVCDGMGGHASGEIASHTALETLVAHLEGGGDLEEAVLAANRAVSAAATADPALEGMGTTLVALLRAGDHYRIANVGDSRAYRIDEAGIEQISEDHSFMAEVIREGRMSREEAARSPWRNAVTRHLGTNGEVHVDFFGPFETTAPHVVVLCSDGAHDVLPAERVEALVRETPSIRDLAMQIGEEALRAGTDDNVSVVALRFGEAPGARTAVGS